MQTADHDLLDRFSQQNDRAAFDELVRKYIHQVYHSALRQTRDAHAADDITQAVFLVLMNKAGSISRSINLAGWLFLTTRYAVANYRKAINRRKKHEAQAAMNETSASRSTEELSDDLDQAIAGLKTSDRDLILNHYFQQIPTDQIAASLQIEEPSVRKRLSRAIGKLRGLLGGKYSKQNESEIAGLIAIIGSQTLSPQMINQTINILTTGGSVSAISIKTGVISMLKLAKIKLIALTTTAILLTGGTLVEVHNMLSAQTIAAAPATKPTSFKAQLKNGVSIEILGISDDPSVTGKWWNPDGSPNDHAPYQKSRGQLDIPPGNVRREIACRINDQLNDKSTARVMGGVNAADSTSGVAEYDTQTFTRTFTTDLQKHLTTSLRWEIAAGKWSSTETVEPILLQTLTMDNHISIIVGKATQTGRDTIVSITGQITPQYDWRLVANTRDGPTLIGAETEGHFDGKTLYLFEVTFRNARADRIKDWHIEYRKFDQWIEFKNISLDPGTEPDFQILTSDDAPAAAAQPAPPAPQAIVMAIPAALKTAPFTDIQFKGNGIIVVVDNQWYQLLGINDISTLKLIQAAKHYDPKDWQKRIAEDLVEMCQKENIPLGDTVNLRVQTLFPKTDTTLNNIPMTEENRREVYKNRQGRGET